MSFKQFYEAYEALKFNTAQGNIIFKPLARFLGLSDNEAFMSPLGQFIMPIYRNVQVADLGPDAKEPKHPDTQKVFEKHGDEYSSYEEYVLGFVGDAIVTEMKKDPRFAQDADALRAEFHRPTEKKESFI